jgi:hypothetical protein
MYRLLYPPVRIDDKGRVRRPVQGDSAQRVYQLQIAPRTARSAERR